MTIQLKKGIVTTSKDPSQTGVFFALIYGLHYILVDNVAYKPTGKPPVDKDRIPNLLQLKGVPVTYTSPYFNTHLGGMFAPPNPYSEVILIYDDELLEYFYMSTLVSPTKWTGNALSQSPTKIVPEPEIYTDQALPKAITFMDHKGAGLKVSNYYSRDTDGQLLNPHVRLRTQSGHEIIMSDVPDERDNIIIRNKAEPPDSIVITDTAAKNPLPERSIVSRSKGPQWHHVDEADYWVQVKDGTEIYFVNSSTGAKAISPDLQRQTGNIHLNSYWRDINIRTYVSDGDDGNVFINTLRKVPNSPQFSGSIVQINSGGEVRIYSASGISIQTNGDFNLNVAGNINIEGNKVNIKTRDDVNIKSGNKLKGEGLNGTSLGSGKSRLDLNDPGGSGANPNSAEIPDPITNGYFE